MRQRILTLELLPGEALQERRLELMLGMSRSPIRAALAQLASEGLVARSGRSFRVVSTDVDELEEIFEFRTLLETAAARMAAKAGADALRPAGALLERVAASEDQPPAMSLTEQFHLELARAAGNRYIVEALASLFPRIAQVRFLEFASPESRRQASEEHAHILELVLQGRGEEAAEAVHAHLDRTRRTFERGVARLGAGARLLRGGE